MQMVGVRVTMVKSKGVVRHEAQRSPAPTHCWALTLNWLITPKLRLLCWSISRGVSKWVKRNTESELMAAVVVCSLEVNCELRLFVGKGLGDKCFHLLIVGSCLVQDPPSAWFVVTLVVIAESGSQTLQRTQLFVLATLPLRRLSPFGCRC